jgi:serine/threonine protein kinase
VRSLDFGATTTPSGAWAPFMVLEWLDGRSLADDLAERRARNLRGRSVAEAFAILQPVAEGLAVAHQRQVVHRDIKPANIFLLAGGATVPQGPLVKVLDFGIAKIMKDGESAGTKGTFASFTWGYASPEQLDPRLGTTGLQTDVYGFALLLTELLTDRQPSDERDVVGVMKAASPSWARIASIICSVALSPIIMLNGLPRMCRNRNSTVISRKSVSAATSARRASMAPISPI